MGQQRAETRKSSDIWRGYKGTQKCHKPVDSCNCRALPVLFLSVFSTSCDAVHRHRKRRPSLDNAHNTSGPLLCAFRLRFLLLFVLVITSAMADQRQRIIASVFSRRNAEGNLEEAYVSHIKIWEDAGAEGGGRKPRYILLSRMYDFFWYCNLKTNQPRCRGEQWIRISAQV